MPINSTGSWIRTYTGERFDPLSSSPGRIVIDDIAHALSNICRYTGHTKEFYSVAQHSVLVAKILEDDGHPPSVQLQGLLHDATEAYLTDLSRPIKMTEALRPYREIETALERILAAHWGFETLTPGAVKVADMQILATEVRDLMGDPQDWQLPYGPRPWKVNPASPGKAKISFLNKYYELMKASGRMAR
jgi:hypothetical protein